MIALDSESVQCGGPRSGRAHSVGDTTTETCNQDNAAAITEADHLPCSNLRGEERAVDVCSYHLHIISALCPS